MERREQGKRPNPGMRIFRILMIVFLLLAAGTAAGCGSLLSADSGREDGGHDAGSRSGSVCSSAAEDEQNGQSSGDAEVPDSDSPDSSGKTNTGTTETEPEPEMDTETGTETAAGQGTSTKAEQLLAEMTLEEKVWQMFLVRPTDITGLETATEAGEETRAALEACPVGGLFYDRGNLVSMEQTQTMLANTLAYSAIAPILTCDEEGGRVNRLMAKLSTTQIGPMLDYRDEGEEKARENAQIIGRDMLSCGFNMDLAPVADVWSNPENTVIGDRAYSTDFEEAARLVAAAVEGFHDSGIACTLKHFPGHGDTSTDSHYGAAFVDKTLDQLRQEELVPFQAGIQAGADAVMIGHLIVRDVNNEEDTDRSAADREPADPEHPEAGLDDGAGSQNTESQNAESQSADEPALFSRSIVTDLLRNEMGFQGVIITDSLDMQAVTDFYTSGETALKAVQAGVDMLLCPTDLEEAVHALLEAVADGELSESRVDESVLRILTLKERYGLLQTADLS